MPEWWAVLPAGQQAALVVITYCTGVWLTVFFLQVTDRMADFMARDNSGLEFVLGFWPLSWAMYALVCLSVLIGFVWIWAHTRFKSLRFVTYVLLHVFDKAVTWLTPRYWADKWKNRGE